jgi:hypothetical protein
MNWEKVDNGSHFPTFRVAVPGGWLYLVSTSARETMCFVPAVPAAHPVFPAPQYYGQTVAPR